MQDKCNSGKWSEYEVRAKRLGKHKYSRRGNSEAYQNPVRTSIIQFFLSISRLVSKGSKIWATQDKMTIKKNGVIMILDARNGKKESMMFYLKAKRYSPEGQEANINIPEKNKYGNDDKEEWRKKLGLSSEMDINVVHRYSHLGESCCVSLITLSESSSQARFKFVMAVLGPRKKRVRS